MNITPEVRHPGEYAHWQGTAYQATGARGLVRLVARQEDSPGPQWHRGVDPRGDTEFTRIVAATDVDWWIHVHVAATWEDLNFQLMRVESDGMGWGYVVDDHRCTSAHATTAELQGGELKQVDRGEVHLGVPLQYLANFRERVTDRKASALKNR
ncbi:hypothetical protein FE374_16790 [Georgenia yuyongxinii]|uniref:Uncharacterized protein n=1 Tax=Georgenia yuyongxinii TaxID=2589797 RepID=A0A5B8CA29_9MICO|nr:hypothetical protein [Georgenia yuyongxinii]QDC26052.1 hypothetical protein FE374_16790 [Georgenia yuyongxinii]